MNLSGRSQAVSSRDAVSNLIARRERELRKKGCGVDGACRQRRENIFENSYGGAFDLKLFDHDNAFEQYLGHVLGHAILLEFSIGYPA